MKRITEFDRPACQAVLDASLAALREAVAPFGVTVESQRGQFDGPTYTAKFKFTAAGADPDRAEFARWAGLFGVTPEDFGRLFQWGGAEYRLDGLQPGRAKFPFSASRVSDGKRFKFPREVIASLHKDGAA